MQQERITTAKLREMKVKGEKIVGLTAWDYLSAQLVEQSGVDIILVGDSLAMTIRGDENTLGVSLKDMLYHTKMVSKAVKRAMVIGDMPFMSYQVSPEQALINAGRFVKEGGAQGVKIEGGLERAEVVARIVGAGIPVMGHIGLTPQSVHQIGGLKVQAREVQSAKKLVADAQALDEAGVFSLVLECLPAELSAYVTSKVSMPTIGIGAGIACDGQIQVTADVLGLLAHISPKHAKKYANLAEEIPSSLAIYAKEVKEGNFPTEANSFATSEELHEAIQKGEL